ncbi:hypothetical protein BGP79_11800 [Tersicoccus sp. Bi-70]|nr:hypothetical protein BGP79_11800 [Tersicoccus sp. Bi-70]
MPQAGGHQLAREREGDVVIQEDRDEILDCDDAVGELRLAEGAGHRPHSEGGESVDALHHRFACQVLRLGVHLKLVVDLEEHEVSPPGWVR